MEDYESDVPPDEEMSDMGALVADESSDEDSFEDDDVPEDELEAEEDEDYDENEQWSWIEGFNTNVKRPIDGKEESVAYCSGRLVNPDMIRGDFYREMEEPSQDLADLAYTLFDRWGCLKEDIRTHPIKRGSGVWGEELHQNVNFLVFETSPSTKTSGVKGSLRV